MIETDVLIKQLSDYYDTIESVPDMKVLRCQKMYNDKPYQYFYFDYSSDISNLDIEEYSKRLLSMDFYSQASMLQWNYYLAFIIENSVDPSLQREIERNEDYARKYVVNYKEMAGWLNQINNTGRESGSELSEDLAGIWRRILEQNKLECVTSDKTSITKGVESIIDGVFHKSRSGVRNKKREKQVTDLGNIQSIDLVKYREYPRTDGSFNFGKVNLIEGANGYGKTSLLEGIEYLLSGETARSTDKSEYDISGDFDKIKNLKSIPKKYTVLRERDKKWYGSVSVLSGSNL